MSMASLFTSNVVVMKYDKNVGRKVFSLEEFEAMFHPLAPKYNPERDFGCVEAGLDIDLLEVYKTGIAPVTTPSFAEQFNGASEPDAIVGRPRNPFDAERMVSAINEGIKEAKSSETKS